MNYALQGTYAFKSNSLNNKSVRTDKGNKGDARARRKTSALNQSRRDFCEARGVFTCTSDMSAYTTAAIFAAIGKATRIAMRFGSEPGNRISTDKFSGQSDFDIRFQTSNGDWDLMASNSDLATRYSFRCMDGFADKIYVLTNSANERFYVKWLLMPRQGEQYMNKEQATGEARKNPTFDRYDRSQSIRRGKALRWQFLAQIVSETEALAWSHDPMDGTQVWDLVDFPLREVGEICLDAMSQGFAQDESQQQSTYVQLGSFYRQLSDQERCNLITNMARSLRYAKSSVQEVIVEHLRCASLDFGYRVAAELELLAQVEGAVPDAAYSTMRLLRLAENGLTLVQSRCL